MKLKILSIENGDCPVEAAFVDGENISKEIKKYFEDRFGEGVCYTFTEMTHKFVYIADGYYEVYEDNIPIIFYLISVETEN